MTGGGKRKTGLAASLVLKPVFNKIIFGFKSSLVSSTLLY